MKTLLSIVALTAALTASASVEQINEVDLPTRWQTGWVVGAGAGANAFHGEPRLRTSITDKVKPNYGAYLGKWMTPRLGFRVAYQGWRFKNCCGRRHTYHNFHLDAMLNALRSSSRWAVSPFVGGGVIRDASRGNTRFSLNYGILMNFKLTKRVNIDLELANAMTFNDFDGRGNGGFGRDNMPTLMAGLSFNIGREKGRRYKRPTLTEETIQRIINFEVDKAEEDTLAVDSVPVVEPIIEPIIEHRTDTVYVTKPCFEPGSQIGAAVYIFFKKNQSTTNLVDANLEEIVQVANENGYTIEVAGSADSATGTEERNLQLAGERADFVIRRIRELDSDVEIVRVNLGGTDEMETPELNRNVKIKLISPLE